MLKRITYWSFATIILLILFLPLLQRNLELFPRKRLINVSFNRKMPLIRWSDIKSGRFQKSFDRWFMQTSGFWGTLATTNNQINYQYFKQISSQYGNGNSFMIGNDYHIFQTSYLRDFNGDNHTDLNKYSKLIKKIKILQDYLEQNGKTLVVITSANKLDLYPEMVPEKYNNPVKRTRLIEEFRKLATKHNINWVDSKKVLTENKEFKEYRYFAKPAAHWNTIGSCLAAKALTERVSKELNKPMHQVICGPEVELKPRPVGADHDLADVINVWHAKYSFDPTPYIKSKRIKVDNAYSPKMLYIGTSFLWSIFDRLEPIRIYNWRDFYYYGSTNHTSRIPEEGKAIRKIVRVDYNKLNWDKDVLNHDVIVFEVNEARIQQVGFAFLPNIIKYLKSSGKIPKISKPNLLNK
jgi:hypothetical protein